MLSRTLCVAVAFAGAAAPLASATPNDVEYSLQQPTKNARFVVRMEPPATGVPINAIHEWRIHLRSPDTAPVSRALIEFAGGMPQHGHGFPTKPRVTREVSPGVYALEGIKFNMTGRWEMRLTIQANAVTDTAVFNVIVTNAGIKR